MTLRPLWYLLVRNVPHKPLPSTETLSRGPLNVMSSCSILDWG